MPLISVGKGSEHRFFTVWLILVLTLSCYAINDVKASPKVEWTQVSNPSTGGDGAWGVAVDASGIYVVGYDNSPSNLEWRIEKISEEVAVPFYMQTWFIVSMAVSVVIVLFAVVIIMQREADRSRQKELVKVTAQRDVGGHAFSKTL